MAAFERGWRQLGTRLWQQLYMEHGTCIYGKYGVTLDANDDGGQAVGTESLKGGGMRFLNTGKGLLVVLSTPNTYTHPLKPFLL